MRVISSLLAFTFLGVAAARAIPEIAALDDTDAGGFPSELPSPTGCLYLPCLPSDVPVDVTDYTKPTGKHSRFSACRRDNSTNTSPPGFSSGGSDHPKLTRKHSRPATSHGANPTDVNTSPLGFPSGGSDHPKPTGKHSRPATSRGANTTGVGSHTPTPYSTDSSDPHSHYSASHRASETAVLVHHSGTPSDGSDHPKHTGKPSRPQASHKFNPTAVHSIHPISRRGI